MAERNALVIFPEPDKHEAFMPFQNARQLLRERDAGALALPRNLALSFFVDGQCFRLPDRLNVRGTRLIKALYSAESRYPEQIYGPLVIVDDFQSMTPQIRDELWNLCRERDAE